MNTPIEQKNIIIAGIVLAVLAAAGIAIFTLSGTGQPEIISEPDQGIPILTGNGFDLGVLQRAGYKAINQQPVQDGLLPVKPPQTDGKANPFL